jgi:coenzyme F420-reducing hydrogenase delta subunit
LDTPKSGDTWYRYAAAETSKETSIAVTAFICVNCARPGQTPDSAGRPRPTVPQFAWPFPVREVLVPCTGRLQPEHLLKAFETGSDLVCAVACSEDNCHYVEGSKRCARRVDYLRGVLDEVGLGSERLLLCHLPGTAAQDMALGAGDPKGCTTAPADSLVEAVRDQVSRALEGLSPNPLHTGSEIDEVAEDPYLQAEIDDDDFPE